jgi:hypothetical protein
MNLAVIQKVIFCEPINLLGKTCSGPCIRFPTIFMFAPYINSIETLFIFKISYNLQEHENYKLNATYGNCSLSLALKL